MSSFYNPLIKNRFLNENEMSESQIDKWRVIFNKTKLQEEILQKDIYEMNRQECEELLHFFKLRSVQYISMYMSNLKQYVYWCDSQGLIPHHINYFEGLGDRKTLKTFISNQAMENQIISEDKLALYTNELVGVHDYQGALIINLLFLGVILDQDDEKCELRNIKVSDIDFENNIVRTNKRLLKIETKLMELVRKAIDQEEMINLLHMEELTSINKKARQFNNSNFLINGRKYSINIGHPTTYMYVVKKIREISFYINNPHINASYLSLSGIIHYIESNYTYNDYNKYKMYEEIIEIYKLSISKEALKSKLYPIIS